MTLSVLLSNAQTSLFGATQWPQWVHALVSCRPEASVIGLTTA